MTAQELKTEALEKIDNDAHGRDSAPGYTAAYREANRSAAMKGRVVMTTVERETKCYGLMRTYLPGAVKSWDAIAAHRAEYRGRNDWQSGTYTVWHVYEGGNDPARTRHMIYMGDGSLTDR